MQSAELVPALQGALVGAGCVPPACTSGGPTPKLNTSEERERKRWREREKERKIERERKREREREREKE